MDNSFILKENFSLNDNAVNETLFHTANGYIGIRGNYEEGVLTCNTTRGSYINAFYETEDLYYEEGYQGFATYNQFILNVFDPQEILFKVGKETFSLFEGEVKSYSRKLDFRKGMVERKVRWKSPSGHLFEFNIKRMTSFSVKEAYLVKYEVKSLNYSGEIELTSSLKGRAVSSAAENDPRIGKAKKSCYMIQNVEQIDNISLIEIKTNRSGLSAVCSSSNTLSKKFTEHTHKGDESISTEYKLNIKNGEKICLNKYVIYTDSKRHQDIVEDNIRLNKAISSRGFDFEANKQHEFLTAFWDNSDIIVKGEGDEDLNKGLRYNLYQLLQSAGRDKFSNIPAKGLSGEGYEGHYFWDTEIYMYPFFLFTNPEVAKNLLLFRYSILDAARRKAKELSHPKGALFAWRTINGDECSAYYPSGTAQYHINTDIAYSIIQYFQVTADFSAISDFGLEILIETARVMYDLGNFRNDGKFVINEVTGPDEYSCCVNNNYYTNVMTRYLFKNTRLFWDKLAKEDPSKFSFLKDKILVTEQEIADFDRAADKMFIPYDETLKIHPQDDAFLDRKVWDLENTPKDKLPLLLHYHPLAMYRHQVCKQPDTVLAHMLLEDETDIATIKNDINYYEKITTHDSSLSTCIFGIMFSRVGDVKKAYEYFIDTVRVDLDNLQGNTHQGIHCASMGGTWMSMTMGFAGMRVIDGELHFRPMLPENWESVKFKINFQGRKLEVNVEENTADIKLLSGNSLHVYINDKKVYIESEENMKINTFIFDLDGVITDTAELHYLAWKKLAEEENLKFDSLLNEKLKGVSRIASLKIILDHNGKVISDQELEDWADRKNKYYKESIKTITPDNILPGMKQTLNKLKNKGINISLGSASKNAKDVLASLKLTEYFDYVGDGNSVKNPKPAPDLFVHIAEHFGVGSENCVVIEDAEAGVLAAKLAGMLAIGIGDKDKLKKADYVYENTGMFDVDIILNQ